MIEISLQDDTRRARLIEWRCDACRKLLLELDPGRPSFLRKVCERCKHTNVWVEAYTPAR